jgi:glycosyltransferase involved in cell wall biosynthesis
MPQSISVVIPVRNDSDRLMNTLQSICDTRSTDIELEVIVVDDASIDDCRSKLICDRANVRIRSLRLDQHVGVPIARNIGSTVASGEVLFMTDSHVTFCENWDRFIIDNMDENRIIATSISDSQSSFKAYGCSLVVPFMGTKWNRELSNSKTNDIQIASSAGTVINKKQFLKIGGYDSGMILYGGAEPEFSVRSWLSGAQIISVPDLTINHRFKQKNEVKPFLEELKTVMVHNSLRFGSLYLSELGILQMIRYYSLTYPNEAQEAIKLLYMSNVWKRRKFLQASLIHDFYWFVKYFNLKNQIGQEVV